MTSSCAAVPEFIWKDWRKLGKFKFLYNWFPFWDLNPESAQYDSTSIHIAWKLCVSWPTSLRSITQFSVSWFPLFLANDCYFLTINSLSALKLTMWMSVTRHTEWYKRMPSVSGAQLIFKGVSILLNRITMKLNSSSLCLVIEKIWCTAKHV